MSFVIGLLTVVLVLDALALIFLVLIQLPKKEAGAGLAFGGGATDALFGAGSGNVLTKITKWAAIFFFGLALILGIMQSRYHHRSTTEFERRLGQSAAAPATRPSPAAPAAGVVTGTNAAAAQVTNAPVPPPTNPPSLPAPQN